MSDKIEDGGCAMSPRAGYRIVTPEDREAHPLVPEGALLYWCDYGEYRPSANAGLPWSTVSNYLIPIGLWLEGDPAPEPATVQVPADLAEEIAGMLDGRAADVETRADGRPWPSERALAERLRLACSRLRACPGYGSDAARTVRKEAAP
jgi:hypothetical protein